MNFDNSIFISGGTVHADGDKGDTKDSVDLFVHSGTVWTQVANLASSDGTAIKKI